MKNNGKIGFVLCAALVCGLTGCVGYVDGPGYAGANVEAGVADDYVYYPGYQVYYSSHRRQYIYREGSSWVSRPAPPRVSVAVLHASPSVRLDFHDSPPAHHATVARQYPKNWAPPASNRGNKEGPDGGNKNDRKGHDKT